MSKYDHDGDGYSRRSAAESLYRYNRSESKDIGGQGQYDNWDNLPRATRASIEANRDRQDPSWRKNQDSENRSFDKWWR